MSTMLVTLRIEEESLHQADRVVALANDVTYLDATTTSGVLKTAIKLGLTLMEAKYTKLAKV